MTNNELTEEQERESPSRALTLKPQRLAGSVRCLNCGTELQGPFCHYCGQPDKNLMRFFPVLIREFFEDFLELDSRFTRTIRPLLFHPGRLSRDYLDGRRFRYVPPMSLFIFSSMIFFILATTLASNAIQINRGAIDGSGVQVTLDELDQLEGIEGVDVEAIKREVEQATEGEESEEDDWNFQFNEEPWDRETNPLVIPFFPDSWNERLNDEIAESPQKEKLIEENPNIILDKIFEILPAAVFVLVPIVALLLKFWYLFGRKFYIEHLIHALHNHAFLFVIFSITLVLNALLDWRDPEGTSPLWQKLNWVIVAAYIWIPFYLLFSLRTMYRQNWFLTIIKYFLIGICYVMLLAFTTATVTAVGFILL